MLSRHLNTFAYDGYGLAQELVTMKSGAHHSAFRRSM